MDPIEIASEWLRESNDCPITYVSDQHEQIIAQYGSKIIIAGAKAVLGAGSELDAMLNFVNVSDHPKLIAGTVESIQRGDFLWIRNMPTGSDFFVRDSATYFQEIVQPNIDSLHRTYATQDQIAEHDKILRNCVYEAGTGITQEFFDRPFKDIPVDNLPNGASKLLEYRIAH